MKNEVDNVTLIKVYKSFLPIPWSRKIVFGHEKVREKLEKSQGKYKSKTCDQPV